MYICVNYIYIYKKMLFSKKIGSISEFKIYQEMSVKKNGIRMQKIWWKFGMITFLQTEIGQYSTVR